MIILYLGIISITISFLLFSYTYQISGLNRTITNIPLQFFELAIPLTTQDEKVTLYYDQNKLIESYENYLEKEVKKYTENYETEYYFYNTTDGGVCDIYDCLGVEIHFSAKLMFNFEYNRTLRYEIVEGYLHE